MARMGTDIFLDNAATTALDPAVAIAMEPYLAGYCGNPSSVHRSGRAARQAVEDARRQLAQLLQVSDRQLVFTSGGTEANHAGIVGAFLAAQAAGSPSDTPLVSLCSGGLRRRHIVVSAIEHHAVLRTCEWLGQLGAAVTTVAPDAAGRLSADAVCAAVRDGTAVVAVMLVNNETGAVQPVRQIAERVKQDFPDVHVHSDMVQALGGCTLSPATLQVDSAAFSAHKIHGPQGMGALYLAPGARWCPVLHGGSQERNRRGGTENVAGVVGFGTAAALLRAEQQERLAMTRSLRDDLWVRLSAVAGVRRNTPLEDTAPGILNVAFAQVRGDRLVARLDLDGVAASAGSACAAGSTDPSHVLLAMGQTRAQALEAIRFSVSHCNTGAEMEAAAEIVARAVAALRAVNGI